MNHELEVLEQEIRKVSPKLQYIENRIRELEKNITRPQEEMGRGE